MRLGADLARSAGKRPPLGPLGSLRLSANLHECQLLWGFSLLTVCAILPGSARFKAVPLLLNEFTSAFLPLGT
jgi:hypothetical protein